MAILGIEGGGTKTTWALLGPEEKILARGEAGPGNTLLLDDAALEKLFAAIKTQAGGDLEAIGAACAGCRQPGEKARVEKVLRKIWPGAASVRVMEDTRSVLAAAFGDGPGIIVIAGTGSNVVGQTGPDAPIAQVGGRGHLFSDRGSAYDLGRRGLELAFSQYDRDGKISPLAQQFLAAAGLGSMDDLMTHALRDLSKTTVAQGARPVFLAAEQGDPGAGGLLEEAAGALADDTAVVAKKLGLDAPRVALVGGLFENQPRYSGIFRLGLNKILPGAKTFLLTVPGVIGAARLAGSQPAKEKADLEKKSAHAATDPKRLAAFAKASTEQRNPRSRGLDRRSIPQLVDLFIREEREVEKALHAQRKNIARAASLIARRLQSGGRLFYVGAGTSGRLGVVDASEMPPTFNAPPEQIQALIAGGPAAIFRSQEGAEDNRAAAAQELKARRLTKKDVVCGIAASGQTPYVFGALELARKVGAGAILLSCNPKRVLKVPVDVAVDLATGPELVTGSTRLKAGTATKLVLNMFSTIANVQLGRVQDNLMVNVQATNDKLRARAVRLVAALADTDEAAAKSSLESNNWRVTAAAEKLKESAPSAKKKKIAATRRNGQK